jgi:hypothetical protein
MSQERCICCSADGPLSDEHWFPRAFGSRPKEIVGIMLVYVDSMRPDFDGILQELHIAHRVHRPSA